MLFCSIFKNFLWVFLPDHSFISVIYYLTPFIYQCYWLINFFIQFLFWFFFCSFQNQINFIFLFTRIFKKFILGLLLFPTVAYYSFMGTIATSNPLIISIYNFYYVSSFLELLLFSWDHFSLFNFILLFYGVGFPEIAEF